MKVRQTKINKRKEQIEVPIFWFKSDEGKIIIDEEEMFNEFSSKVEEIKANPKRFTK